MIDIEKLGGIYFENINVGFEKYSHSIIKMDREEIVNYIAKLTNERNNDVYVDFYYNRLGEEEKARVNTLLCEEDIKYINTLEKREIIFEMTPRLLKIAALLNECEMLFSTIYVIGEDRQSLWGNYNKEYVIFRSKKMVKIF